jgi:6-pyruvoyltetrahydropterin/6-carboxytetrahydropterin synthase
MRASLTRRYRFSASHRLHSAAFSDEQNARLYGKCNHPFGHGHNYTLSVTLTGPVNAETGLLVGRAEVDALVSEKVLHLFAHRNVNSDVPQFETLVPTTENIAAIIVQILEENWATYIPDRRAVLARVHVQETDRNAVEIVVPRRGEQRVEHRIENVIVHA